MAEAPADCDEITECLASGTRLDRACDPAIDSVKHLPPQRLSRHTPRLPGPRPRTPSHFGRHHRECLEMLGCYGSGKVRKLAEIVAATVLCGELSLGSAVVAEEWVEAHDLFGRNRP
jgi:hydroxymethylglutaryl-coenzyme A reductase